jgi:[acyl-carrier-protein] S-malonyltransferase
VTIHRHAGIAVVNNIDVAVETDPDRIRDALVRQAFGPVRWVEVVQALQARGATHIVECGPGRCCRDDPAHRARPGLCRWFDPASLAEAKGLLS